MNKSENTVHSMIVNEYVDTNDNIQKLGRKVLIPKDTMDQIKKDMYQFIDDDGQPMYVNKKEVMYIEQTNNFSDGGSASKRIVKNK